MNSFVPSLPSVFRLLKIAGNHSRSLGSLNVEYYPQIVNIRHLKVKVKVKVKAV